MPIITRINQETDDEFIFVGSESRERQKQERQIISRKQKNLAIVVHCLLLLILRLNHVCLLP